jgi:DNA-directed RNA polymerase subunit N (RpoN/RPB10)
LFEVYLTICGHPSSQLGVATLEPGRIVGMAWTHSELLVVAQEGGAVEVFDVLGARTDKSFTFFPAQSKERLMSVSVCGSGMAAVSSTADGLYPIYLVYDLDHPAPVRCRSTGAFACDDWRGFTRLIRQ